MNTPPLAISCDHDLSAAAVSDSTLVARLLALSQCPGLGPKAQLDLLATAGGDPLALWACRQNPGVSPAHWEAFEAMRQAGDPEALLARYQSLGIAVVTMGDPQYPKLLKEIYDPPLALLVRGNVSALNLPQLAVVGNRDISDYGRRVTQVLIEQLAAGFAGGSTPTRWSVVSGLAQGIDGQAHQSALDFHLPTVAVFGCGIDQIYPKFHQRLAEDILAAGGALVSEFGLGTPGSKWTFPRRNRIVAGMATGVLVVEGGEKSGSLITARFAMEENRLVFAVPGSIFAPGSLGPHQLIQEGAIAVQSAQTILNALAVDAGIEQARRPKTSAPKTPAKTASAPLPPPADTAALPESQQAILRALTMGETQSLDALTAAVALPSATVLSELTMLELDGWVQTLPGARVQRLK